MTPSSTTLPTVSVHMLTYNSASFVREAINSILQQDYPGLQIVISDDASRDDTTEIIREYECKYPGIFTVNLNAKNLGITKNANAALSLCTGEFVAFHAGDDVMLPNKLHTQVAYFTAHPECVLCYHDLDIFDSDSGKSIGRYNGYKHPARKGTVRQLIRHGCFAGGCSVMVRRAHLPLGGFNEEFPVASDWQMWIATLLPGGEIGFIDNVLARYRRHSTNTTSIASPLNRQAVLDALNTSNWVMVNHPEYMLDALASYAIHVRLLRRLGEKSNYVRALIASLRIAPTLPAVVALLAYWLTLGRKRL